MRYRTLLEQTVDEWEDGYGVVQIVTPEGADENELRFCYYKDGEFVNRPLTIAPTEDAADKTGEVVETMASLARTFTADESEALVEELGEEKILELSVLIEEYDLEGIGAELEQYWTADEDRRSLRELADYFNRNVLEAALDSAGVQHLDGETENTYRLLTDDDVSSADRTRVRRRLERDGVDVDDLEGDFVTYQAIRSYLKDHRGAEYTPDETDPLEREKTNVQQLRGRMAAVTEGKLEQLRDSGRLTLGEFRTLPEIRVVCEDCNTQFDAVELLERGGCDCSTDE
jgi:hypothetical protein